MVRFQKITLNVKVDVLFVFTRLNRCKNEEGKKIRFAGPSEAINTVELSISYTWSAHKIKLLCVMYAN